QDPETRIQDQSILSMVFIAAAKLDFKILCNYRVQSVNYGCFFNMPVAEFKLKEKNAKHKVIRPPELRTIKFLQFSMNNLQS
ncbi:hypothetical protein D1BOALGB6SA_10928, partial [Olavius sp. associated proteobacterium Delta 1]